MKDNFSSQADKYAKYRPNYPSEFFVYLNSIVKNKKNVWDCGTGNGQVAVELAKSFDHVFATDISQSQINNALHLDNILYSVQPAERTTFNDNQFDLVVVAQAIHWFDFEKFYAEVRRTTNDGTLLCILGYNRLKISAQIDNLITNFYKATIGKYWDKERKFIDENYHTIPFPFDEIETPSFENIHKWTLDHLIGYLNTWSAVKHFINQNGFNPIVNLRNEIEKLWGSEEEKQVSFPLLLRIGKLEKNIY